MVGGWALTESRKGNSFWGKGDPMIGCAVLPPSTYLNPRVKLSWTSPSQALGSVPLRGSPAYGDTCIDFDDQPWDKEQFYLSDVCRVLFCLLFHLSFCPLVPSLEANNNFVPYDLRSKVIPPQQGRGDQSSGTARSSELPRVHTVRGSCDKCSLPN